MRRAILAATLLLAGNSVAADTPPLPEYYEALRTAGVDAARSAAVSNLVVEDGDVRLILVSGVFYPLEAVAGEEHGGVFVGRGQFFYSPPNDTESEAMERFVARNSLTVPKTGLDVVVDERGDIQVRVQAFKRELILQRPFEVAVLRFSPDQWRQLGLKVEQTEGRDRERAARAYESRHALQRTVVDKGQDGFDIDLHVLESHLPSARPRSFLSVDIDLEGFAFKREQTGRSAPWLSYWRSDDDAEEHQLYVLERRTAARNLDRAVRAGSGVGDDVVAADGASEGGFNEAGGEGGAAVADATLGTNLGDEQRSPGLQRTVVASFHDEDERRRYPAILLASESHPRFDLEHHELELAIGKGKHEIVGTATLTIRAEVDATTGVALKLANAQPKPDNLATFGRLTVTAARDAAGNPLQWVHRGGTVLVRLADAVPVGERSKVTIEWRGHVIWPSERTGAMEALPTQGVGLSGGPTRNRGLDFLPLAGQAFSPLAGFPWVPQSTGNDPFTTDWTVCVPRRFEAIVTGTSKKRFKRKKQRCVHAVETKPVRAPAVFFGLYDCEEKELEGIANVRVCALPRQARSTRGYIAESEGMLKIYEVLFGKYPYEELEIVQLGFDDTRSFSAPGVVALEGRTFISKQALANATSGPLGVSVDRSWDYSETTSPVRVDLNLRHEVFALQAAQQWWGHKVAPRSYRDQWLIDAAARYAAGIYMSRLRDDADFEERRAGWFERAIRSDWGGPLELGPRLRETYEPAAHNKGPAVLHMLRGEMSGDKFFECLRTLGELADGRAASTEELRHLCERVHGTKLDWFYDTWVRRSGIPAIEYTYKVVPRDGESSYDLALSIRQKDTKHKLRLPLVVKYGKKQKSWAGVFLADASQEVTLPGLPKRPTDVVVDTEWLLIDGWSRKEE